MRQKQILYYMSLAIPGAVRTTRILFEDEVTRERLRATLNLPAVLWEEERMIGSAE